MIDYYEQLTQEEKEEVTDVIQTLYRQTFLLERKFDKRAERMQYTKEYCTCTKHLEFFKAYFEVAGIILRENVHMGVIYIQGEQLWGEKLPRLATIYLLVLKLIYDEQPCGDNTWGSKRKNGSISCIEESSVNYGNETDDRTSEEVPDHRAA